MSLTQTAVPTILTLDQVLDDLVRADTGSQI